MADPIELSLRTEGQIALARLQDKVVQVLFNLDPDIVMHGGTAIWRCYNGGRFSEDIDIYASDAQVKRLSNELTFALNRRGVTLDYPKHSNRSFEYSDGFARSRLQIMERPSRMRPVQREYTASNGTKFPITTLSASDMVREKIATYNSRRFARDLYDIYHLVNNEQLDDAARRALAAFSKQIERPVDKEKLRDLVYAGVAPTFDTMISSMNGKVG